MSEVWRLSVISQKAVGLRKTEDDDDDDNDENTPTKFAKQTVHVRRSV